MTLKATLFRHWLELRSPLRVVALPGGILLALGDLAALASVPDSPLEVHGACSVIAALIAGITCGGSGVRTASLMPGHPSIHYTLTLPVSRFRLVWTRSIAGVLAGAVFTAPILIATLLFWAFGDSSFSIRAVVTISLMCGLIAIATQAIFQVALPLWNENLGPYAVTAAFITVVYSSTVRSSWHTGVTSIVPPVSPILVAALALVAVVSLPLAAFIARRRDF